MRTTTIPLGAQGEELACRYLRRHGYTIVRRNWRTRAGEVDIVARHVDQTVIVEVKTRSGFGYGHPFEAITPVKVARLRGLAREWCRENGASVAATRIDAIAVTLFPEQPAVFEHLQDIS